MLIQSQPELHLTYCLNIHRGETWAANFGAIRDFTLAVRQIVWPEKKFGLGLRLSHRAVHELAQPAQLIALRQFLADSDLYAYTINGFPFGQFHDARVKEAVYQPDWRTSERRDYTCRLADVLVQLLPAGMEGSISSVPVGYKPHWPAAGAEEQARAMLLDTVMHLRHLHDTTGRVVHLGLEPEPDCVLETTGEAIAFFQQFWRAAIPALRGRVPAGQEETILRRHLGVCFDTCHAALQFEDPALMLRRYALAGVRVSKIQISAALETTPAHREAIRPFDEPVYLHQVKALRGLGVKASWADLPLALADWPEDAEKIRIHFHVPMFWGGTPAIRPTTHTLTPDFWKLARGGACGHLEVETYSFGMMPEDLRPRDLVRSLVEELRWTGQRLGVVL